MDQRNINEQILQFWYITEFLTQNSYPHVKNTKAEKRTSLSIEHLIKDHIDIFKKSDQDYYSMKNLPVKSNTIDICLGKVSRDACVKTIYKLSNQRDDRINQTKQHIAFMGMQISFLKRYVPGTFNLSPIIWAIYKLASSSIDDLRALINVEEYKKDMQDIESWLLKLEEVDMELLKQCFEKVKSKFILSNANFDIPYEGIFSYRRYSNEQTKEKDIEISNFSNLTMNFFSQDLNMLKEMNRSNALSVNEYGRKFIHPYIASEYQNDTELPHRINVLKDSDENRKFLKGIMHIKNAPMGKWPSRYSPVFMQQLAINLAISQNHKSPTHISVNGPPGTGKTTMLKEIIADSIVKKAEIMCTYNNSNDAFTECDFEAGDCKNHSYSKYFDHYYKVDDKLNNYAILVASSNNTAVENITKELPDGEGLSANLMNKNDKEENEIKLRQIRHYFDQQDADIYFTKYANEFFNTKESNQYFWGLISVPLGNKSNQGSFTSLLLNLFKNEFSKNEFIEQHKEKYKKAVELFQKQLDIVNQMKQKISSACNAETALKDDQDRIDNDIQLCNQEISSYNKMIEDSKKLIKDSNHTKKLLQNELDDVNKLQNTAKQLCDEKEQVVLDIQLRKQLLKENLASLEDHRTLRDSLFAIFHVKTLKNTEIEQLYQNLSEVEIELANADEQYQLALHKYDDTKTLVEHVKTKIDIERKKIIESTNKKAEYEAHIQEKKKDLKNLEIIKEEHYKQYKSWLDSHQKQDEDPNTYDILDDAFLDALFNSHQENNLRAHLSNPWIHELYNREREKLFYYALQVNKEFLLSSKNARSNLKYLLMMWTGTDGKNPVKFQECDKINAFTSLFQTLSLLVPVISTTFASVARFLQNIKDPYQLGTLIIDEAGQAQPHMALGAMMRCRKVVIVGDPKQVEPVVTDDLDAIKQLIKNNITAPYINKHLSVQQFADDLNPYGTYFEEQSGDSMWVGCPLVVHRRCINPMFDISNAISYSGIMKQQTAEPSKEKMKKFALTFSQWYQCAGKEKDHVKKNHFVDEQGQIAAKIIETAFEKANGELPSIFIISPFTSVVEEMKEVMKNSTLYKMNSEKMDDWIKENIGTVHTFQGKEANEVIFLLGCDQDALNAVKWVNSNIINVAVTRAKYRLCVIGDYQVWKYNKYVKTMKGIFDAYTMKELDMLKKETPSEENKKMAKLLMQRIPKTLDYIEHENEDTYINTNHLMKGMRTANFDFNELTDEELNTYHLTHNDLNDLDYQIKSHLLMAIKINSIFDIYFSKFKINCQDRSFRSILLFKATELYVRQSFKNGLKEHFPDEKIGNKVLSKARNKDFTLNATAACIRNHFKELHDLIGDLNHDLLWWKCFTANLKNVGELRNKCCHVDLFDENQEHELYNLLFQEKTFKNIKIGKSLEHTKSSDKGEISKYAY